MAKQAINVGVTANDKKGDSLRAAFQKVNANFTELYEAVGLAAAADQDTTLTFSGSTLSTDDSSSIVIDRATTVTSNLSVGGDIVPQTANGGDLGSSTLPWRSLYVSNSTIYIGGTAVGVDANGNLTTGGTVVGSTPSWAGITGKPTFATVATTGAYADLTGNPTIPTLTSQLTNDAGFVTAASIPTDFKGSVFADDSTLMIDAVDNKIYATELTVAVGNFVNVNSNNVDVENINGLASQINFTVGGYNNLVIENNLVTIQNVSLSVAGDITLGGDIRSEGNINIEINLSDSTKRIWQFGEDGNLTFPDGTSQSTALRTSQDESSVAIGGSGTDQAGGLSPQGGQAIAIGLRAARTAQGGQAIAIGSHAGDGNQGIGAVAIGTFAGYTNQITNAIAIGTYAGQTNQGSGAIAIGRFAGFTGQAIRSIAIGDSAGKTNQHEGTIVLNSTGSPLDTDGTGRFYVASVRNSNSPNDIVYYNSTTKEVTYGAPPTPTDIRSEGNINIEINLSDSTLRRWSFGEDGDLAFPDGTTQTTAYQTSIVRAQRASGGISTTPDKWTFTTVTGSVTAEWVVDGAAAYPALGLNSNPYIIFTLTGFTKLPETFYRLGVTGSSPGLTNDSSAAANMTNKTSPNILTAFDPTLHKYAFSEGSTIAEDIYWEFRI